MTKDLKSALESWKEADANARAAENELKKAWVEYEARRATAIPDTLIKKVADLRDRANERLTLALELLHPERPNGGQR